MDNEQEKKRLQQEKLQQLKQETQRLEQETQRLEQKVVILKFLQTVKKRVLNDESTALNTALYSMIQALNALQGSSQGKLVIVRFPNEAQP